MLLQQSVDVAIAATDALEDGAFGGVVEEAGVVPGDFAGEVEDEAVCYRLQISAREKRNLSQINPSTQPQPTPRRGRCPRGDDTFSHVMLS